MKPPESICTKNQGCPLSPSSSNRPLEAKDSYLYPSSSMSTSPLPLRPPQMMTTKKNDDKTLLDKVVSQVSTKFRIIHSVTSPSPKFPSLSWVSHIPQCSPCLPLQRWCQWYPHHPHQALPKTLHSRGYKKGRMGDWKEKKTQLNFNFLFTQIPWLSDLDREFQFHYKIGKWGTKKKKKTQFQFHFFSKVRYHGCVIWTKNFSSITRKENGLYGLEEEDWNVEVLFSWFWLSWVHRDFF